MAGEWIAPAQTTTPRARTSMHSPPTRARTPVARPASTSTLSTSAAPRILRFARSRAGSRYASLVVTRAPSRALRPNGDTPVAVGALWSSLQPYPSPRAASASALSAGPHSSRGTPLDRDRTVHTVVGLVAEVGVALHPPQVGQHVGVRPPRAAERRPAVVVVRNGTEGHHAVDRRGAAKAPAAQVRPRLLYAGAARLQALPLERRARRLVERPPAVDAAQLHGGLARTPVRPGLQHHDLLGRVFAQASGEHAPGAATTDDQPVRFDRPWHHPPTFIHTLLVWVSSSSDAAPSVRPWPESFTPP